MGEMDAGAIGDAREIEGHADLVAGGFAEQLRERAGIHFFEFRESLAILLEDEFAVGSIGQGGQDGRNFGTRRVRGESERADREETE